MSLLKKIRESQDDFLSTYNTMATHVYLGKDVRFVIEHEQKDELRQLNIKGIVPWRYMKLFGMIVVPVEAEMYFAIGFAQNIMYDI